jgi:hypothetical protein
LNSGAHDDIWHPRPAISQADDFVVGSFCLFFCVFLISQSGRAPINVPAAERIFPRAVRRDPPEIAACDSYGIVGAAFSKSLLASVCGAAAAIVGRLNLAFVAL